MSSRIDKMSHFCIFDGATGEQLSCPESSNGHFFFSAIVDHGDDGQPATVWVFGSAWDRAQKPAGGKGWGPGPCADALQGTGGGCHVGVWKSTDLTTWSFAKAVTLPLPMTVANVGVSMIPSASRATPTPGLPVHQAFMALEIENHAPNVVTPLALNTRVWGRLAGRVRFAFLQIFTPKDAIGSHACSLEALACV
jgi:hypothetical protein